MTVPFKTLLLTGAAGFVGRHLAPALLPLATRTLMCLARTSSRIFHTTPVSANVSYFVPTILSIRSRMVRLSLDFEKPNTSTLSTV